MVNTFRKMDYPCARSPGTWEIRQPVSSARLPRRAESLTFPVAQGKDLLETMAKTRVWFLPVLGLLVLAVTAVVGGGTGVAGRGRAKGESCRARHPQQDKEIDGDCIPLLECVESLRVLGRFKFPKFCGVRVLNPIVCCPRMGKRMTAAPPASTARTTVPSTTTSTTRTTVAPNSQLILDAPCKDENGVDGKCVPLDHCEALKRAAEKKQFPPLCDFKMGAAYVCCVTQGAHPQVADTSGNSTNSVPASPVTAQQLLEDNERYCGKKHYARKGQVDFRPVIFGGKDAPEGKYKFAVAIFRNSVSVLNFWCGGTLITKRIVLSAAHCFHDTLNGTKYIARIGGVDIKHNGEGPFIQRGISDIRIHPEYDPTLYYADVAVLRLDSVAAIANKKVPGACLPDVDAEPDQTQHAFVLGWGHDTFGGKVQTHLQEAEVPLVSREECDSAYQTLSGYEKTFPRGIDENFVCAGNGFTDACQQDSGGPLVVRTTTNSRTYWEVVGVVSFGVGCGSKDYPGVYSRVSTFVPWIVRTAIALTPPVEVTRGVDVFLI